MLKFVLSFLLRWLKPSWQVSWINSLKVIHAYLLILYYVSSQVTFIDFSGKCKTPARHLNSAAVSRGWNTKHVSREDTDINAHKIQSQATKNISTNQIQQIINSA